MTRAEELLKMAEDETEIEHRVRKDGCTEVKVTEQWETLPGGWTEESLRSFWKSLTGDRKHKITACIKKMEGTEITDPGAFCASLARRLGAD